jgi:Family of unknown function (DUF6065)
MPRKPGGNPEPEPGQEGPQEPEPRIVAYEIHSASQEIRAGVVERAWMSGTDQRFAYRCLPLNVANQLGWDLLVREPFTAVWNGGTGQKDVEVTATSDRFPYGVSGFFGHGLLTFNLGYLFRTPKEVDLLVCGPFNHPKDGLHPLTGIVETDWSHATFTMNYVFTRPDHPVSFDEGEPFCRIVPVQRHLAERLDAQIRPVDDDPELAAAYRSWSENRLAFNRDLKVPGSQARRERWQKDYFRASQATEEQRRSHRVRLGLKEFRRPESLVEDAPEDDADARNDAQDEI